jgi:hypothetical protein
MQGTRMRRIEYGTTPETTVVLWHGQYVNDAYDALATVKGRGGIMLRYMSYRDPRVVGSPGRWYVVAEAYIFEPEDTDLTIDIDGPLTDIDFSRPKA